MQRLFVTMPSVKQIHNLQDDDEGVLQ